MCRQVQAGTQHEPENISPKPKSDWSQKQARKAQKLLEVTFKSVHGYYSYAIKTKISITDELRCNNHKCVVIID